jgi:Polysaccharide deacetylase
MLRARNMVNLNKRMKPVLMIHEITDDLFKIDLEKYILTFDDGLYSQYYYFDKFKAIPTQKIYFISSNIVCKDTQSTDFPTSVVAHNKAVAGNYEDFMTVDQIKELAQQPNVTIGGHGHNHNNLKDVKLFDLVNVINEDTTLMIDWFNETLGFTPTYFCFPYNYDPLGIYRKLLRNYGIKYFFSNERIPVERLLRDELLHYNLDT